MYYKVGVEELEELEVLELQEKMVDLAGSVVFHPHVETLHLEVQVAMVAMVQQEGEVEGELVALRLLCFKSIQLSKRWGQMSSIFLQEGQVVFPQA